VLVRSRRSVEDADAIFVLLDWQATESSASEIFASHVQACLSCKPIIYRKRPILLLGGGVSVGKRTHVRVRALESRKDDRSVWSGVDEYGGGRASVEYAMAWLDPGEDILHLLRGTDGRVAPPPPSHSEAVFDLLLLTVVCGMLFAMMIAGPVHLWRRLGEALRLKRRIAAAARDLLSASSKIASKRAK
jgi:hypothetical protein